MNSMIQVIGGHDTEMMSTKGSLVKIYSHIKWVWTSFLNGSSRIGQLPSLFFFDF